VRRCPATGAEINEIVSHEDWVPTLVAAAGDTNVTGKLLTGYQAAGKTFDVATTRRRPVVFEEDDDLDVPDFLK